MDLCGGPVMVDGAEVYGTQGMVKKQFIVAS